MDESDFDMGLQGIPYYAIICDRLNTSIFSTKVPGVFKSAALAVQALKHLRLEAHGGLLPPLMDQANDEFPYRNRIGPLNNTLGGRTGWGYGFRDPGRQAIVSMRIKRTWVFNEEVEGAVTLPPEEVNWNDFVEQSEVTFPVMASPNIASPDTGASASPAVSARTRRSNPNWTGTPRRGVRTQNDEEAEGKSCRSQ